MPGNNEKGEEMPLDPEPWVDTKDGERAPDIRFWPWADFAPRPEYSQDWRDYR